MLHPDMTSFQCSGKLKWQRQQGFSLIEVLVSTIVLSIGLLGLAAVQTTAYRFNHDNYLRSVAMAQVDAIVDRMRANSRGVQNGKYNQFTAVAEQALIDSGKSKVVGDCVSCTPESLAEVDYHHWNDENATTLPGGKGYISGNGQIFTVTVMWDNGRTGATGTNCSGNPKVDLTCLRVTVEL